ncbi:hypothetical protein HMPREF1246_1014 [Acidaminococcus sp. BV3L6]|nr:hypothetical protein HMPREF1246_1014 [Acidaminococcus sp. BV3L6]
MNHKAGYRFVFGDGILFSFEKAPLKGRRRDVLSIGNPARPCKNFFQKKKKVLA